MLERQTIRFLSVLTLLKTDGDRGGFRVLLLPPEIAGIPL